MQRNVEGLQRSIDYIEQNLAGSLEIREISKVAAISTFYYQRLFVALCGMTVGDYIRSRRMTLAAQDLSAGNKKVIDVALKYGYSSPDSFSKAFTRFHGVSPSKAGRSGAQLRSFSPMHIRVSMEGGETLSYRIVRKEAFSFAGIRRRFEHEHGFLKVPRFWEEWYVDRRGLKGMYGIWFDCDEKRFDYWIADPLDADGRIPDGCESVRIPSGLWAQFRCTGPLPQSLHSMYIRIWTEWAPALSGYSLGDNYSVEVYSRPTADPQKRVTEILIPLKPG